MIDVSSWSGYSLAVHKLYNYQNSIVPFILGIEVNLSLSNVFFFSSHVKNHEVGRDIVILYFYHDVFCYSLQKLDCLVYHLQLHICKKQRFNTKQMVICYLGDIMLTPIQCRRRCCGRFFIRLCTRSSVRLGLPSL
jgi:hypothetical protein